MEPLKWWAWQTFLTKQRILTMQDALPNNYHQNYYHATEDIYNIFYKEQERVKNLIAKFKNIKHGDWIFTCSMKPLQFDSFKKKNPDSYPDYVKLSTELEQELNFNFDNFITTNGSSHSTMNCSLKPISETYAKWFLENNIDELYNTLEKNNHIWENYEKLIRAKCIADNIEYEGF